VDGHGWNEWQTIPPTCTEDGKDYRVCNYCGMEDKHVIPATGHIWDDNEVCIICGEKNELWRYGFCGRPEVNDGKNVTFLLTTDADKREFLTISKSPDAVGDDCCTADYDLYDRNPGPWLDVKYTYSEDGFLEGFSYTPHAEYIVIEEGVTGIGQQALSFCEITKSVIIPASVTYIGLEAFYDCINMKDVYCLADPDKLTWDDYVYDDFNTYPDSLRATKMHVFSYHLAKYEQKFSKINVTFVGDLDDYLDGITPINKKEESEEIYDLNGRKLDKPQKGLNIIRNTDGITKKVLVK